MMGTTTVVEIMSDIEQAKLLNETKEKIVETKQAMTKMDSVLISIKKSLKSGKQITPQQAKYLKVAAASKPKLIREIRNMEEKCDTLRKVIDMNSNVFIRVEGVVNTGVKIVIKDISKIINDNISKCKFVREGADIKCLGIY